MSLSRVVLLVTLGCGVMGCEIADLDGTPSSPSPPPAASTIAVENFTASSTPAGSGVSTYRIAFMLRETTGVAATLSDVTLTALTGLGGISRSFTAMQAFGTNRIAAGGTVSASVTLEGPSSSASQLRVRVPFTDDRGNTGTAEGLTTVTTGS